jgi:sterol desaturase/sphingolipid hydroxylase (fatty acid hydroxylase superfamily)
MSYFCLLAVTTAVPFCVYWFWALFFLFLDTRGLCRGYKLDHAGSEPISQFYAAAPGVIRDQLSFGVLSIVALPLFSRSVSLTISTPAAAAIKFLLFGWFVQSMSFYYLHRLFHSRYLYNRIHRVHHFWVRPSAVVAASAHPVENVVLNAGPIVLAIWLGQPSLVSLILFLSWALTRTCWDHSGYDVPWLSDGGHHDRHHKLLAGNYGIELLDRLHGTLLPRKVFAT